MIFDEAHHLRKYGASLKSKKTRNYELAEDMKDNCSSMLLLTATPMQLDTAEYYGLIELLDPTLFGGYDHFEHIRTTDRDKYTQICSNIIIRNKKREVLDIDITRKACILQIKFTDTEKELYNGISAFIKTSYNEAIEADDRITSFLMVIYQKMLTSSHSAIMNSFKRRIVRLKENKEKRPECDTEEDMDEDIEEVNDELIGLY